MSAIKDGRLPITLDKERHILFSLNVLDEMQDKFGGFENLPEALKGKDVFKNVKWLLTRLLNEGAGEDEEPLAEAQVGKLIHAQNLNEIISLIYSGFHFGATGSTEPEDTADEGDPEDTEEAEEKNAMGGQG